MAIASAHLPRFRPMAPWANRILRIDLSEMTIRAQEAEPYIPADLGGRGFAARLAWEEYPRPAPPWDPANPLMVFAGALTGSRAPYAGRAIVCGFSPQAWPHPWLTRSSIGKRFGGELKRAGYDGLVITGAAERPVQIAIRDDEVSILPADDLWGLDALDTLEALHAGEEGHARALSIGPAGERLSRIATIQTASSSAAGQGGFGGVMGSKRLKAVSVVGTGRVPLAHPERVAALARAFVAARNKFPFNLASDLTSLNEKLAAEGSGRARRVACSEGCVTPCCAYLEQVPSATQGRPQSGAWMCVAEAFVGAPGYFHLDYQSGFEMNVLSNRYGLNQFDILGQVIWLIRVQKQGLISQLDGQPMDWSSPRFWAHYLHAVAYREGQGDVLAEGAWRAAQRLHVGEQVLRNLYGGWGQCGHWDGRLGKPPFPTWLVSALQWLSDTRDPFDSGHSYVRVAHHDIGEPLARLESSEARQAALDMARALGQRVYGDADAFDPYSGYRGKARPAARDRVEALIKDSVPVDDLAFPLVHDPLAPDGLRVLRGVEGLGDVPGPQAEYVLFREGTGLDWPEEQFIRAAERGCALERALLVRHWGRDRSTDELVLPYFEQPEMAPNPLLGQRYGLDRAQFAPVVDEFYALQGWDQRGWPTRESLDGLGLGDVYEPMVRGAAGWEPRDPRV